MPAATAARPLVFNGLPRELEMPLWEVTLAPPAGTNCGVAALPRAAREPATATGASLDFGRAGALDSKASWRLPDSPLFASSLRVLLQPALLSAVA